MVLKRMVPLIAVAALVTLAGPYLLVAPRAVPPVIGTFAEETELEAANPVPAFLPDIPPGMSTRERKETFFRFLLPLVQEENRRLAAIRSRLRYYREHLISGRDLAPEDRLWLEGVRRRYEVKLVNYHRPEFWSQILERVDEIPEDLVLIQAA